MKKLVVLAGLFLLLSTFGCTSKAFQSDADIYRMKHLKYYGELIEEYKAKVGKYPFEGMENKPIYVFVANSKQEKYVRDDNPNPHHRYDLKVFIQTLEEGLGRQIDEYYDPQFAPDSKPNFYIYMQAGKQFYFAVHLSQGYGIAKKVAEGYYKLEITDEPIAMYGLFGLSELVKNEYFNEAINAVPTKKAFFDDRVKAFLNETKQ